MVRGVRGSILVALLLPTLAAATPSQDDWVPIHRDGDVLTDPCGDTSQGRWDIVGDADHPAAEVAFDGTDLWFRIRTAGRPAQEGRWEAFGWGVMFDLDLDETCSYDFLLFVDGNSDLVSFAANTAPSDPFTSDPPEDLLASWPAPALPTGDPEAGYATWAPAGDSVCSGEDPDYHLVWRMPWADFALFTGADTVALASMVFGTSTSAQRFDKDIAGCDGDDGCGDWCRTASDQVDLTDPERVDDGDNPWSNVPDAPFFQGGCTCTVSTGASGWLLLWPALLAFLRRRERLGVTPPPGSPPRPAGG